ncbi:MAG: 6-carboxytetrahydropterin synthase [Acidobacteriaceae bacterium]|nr:6-carboxytetrahydropterin synthase [Acidobacteriaceae bacterium]
MAAPRAHLSRRWTFVAAHRLHVDALSAEANREVFGKCNNPFGHGHNYIVQATFSGPIDPATGMVTNLGDLDAFARVELLDHFDHQNLNMLEIFRDQVSTTENLAIEIWRIFKEYPHAKLKRIRVEETGNNAFDYFGEGE